MHTIDREQLRDLLESERQPRVVMTLGSHRYAQAHIPGSETFDTLDAALAELDPEEDIVLYCTGGRCPAVTFATRALTARGYRSVRVYEGGLMDWQEAELPMAGSQYVGDRDRLRLSHRGKDRSSGVAANTRRLQ